MSFGSMHDQDDAPMSDINVTPLVDVMLVLLIVFMITMPVLTHSIPINLPTSNDKPAPEIINKDNAPLNISVDIQGQYAIGTESTQTVDLEQVKIQLSQIGKDNPDRIIAISADKHTPYEHVAKLLEVAREAKLSKIGFQMETAQ